LAIADIHNLRYSLDVCLEGLGKSIKVRIPDLMAFDFWKNGRPKIHNEDPNSPLFTHSRKPFE
jgi:hypothetical protein